jgi:uncharacterized membrane protein YcaP (DUF421 family)
MGTILRAVFGYCFLVFMIRVVGRRPGKQMTPFEYVLIFFIGGLVLSPVLGDDRSISNAMCVIMTVALMHILFAWLKQRSQTFGRIIDGTPLILYSRGKCHTETMDKMGIADDDIIASARDKGLMRLNQIKYAILERNGEISIIPDSEAS